VTARVLLQCQLECSVDPTVTATGTVPITVHGDPDVFSLSLAADALVILSGGTWEHGCATWWSDAGVGGYFSPAQPAEADYTVRNTRGRDMPVVLSATADCGGWPPQYSMSSLIISVQPDPHSFWVTVSSPQPAVLTGGGTSQLNATYTDWQGHGLSSWVWSDGGAGGVFSPSPDVPNPTYAVPLGAMAADTVIALTVTATCDGPEQLSDTATTLLVVSPAAPGSYQVAGSELPIGMAWDESLLASVTCQNTGSTTWSPGSYQLLDDGQLGRWGAKAVDLTSPVPPGQGYDDAMRLGPELLGPEGLTGTWQVQFELRDAATPQVPAISIYGATRLFGVDELNAAKSAALTTGMPYYQVSWRLPGGMTPGQYVLVVSAEDENGNLRELARRVPLTVAP